jgi:hypothetical protein
MLNYSSTQMIYVAAKLNIADFLANGPKSVEEIAATVGAHPRSLYRLLRALASLGIFEEDSNGRFGLTPLAELLRTEGEGSFHAFALSYGEPWWWDAWGRLLHSVQTGGAAFNFVHDQSLFEYLDQHPDAAKIFNANMRSMTAGEAQSVVGAFDFSNSSLVIDVGGGLGTMATAVLQSHPKTRAILFDLPSVVAGAREHLADGVKDRCQFVAGSFFEWVPLGGDTYLLKDIIHDWDDARSVAILRNCRRAMSDPAKLLLIERIIPPGNDPAVGKLVDISMLVMTGGMERTENEYRALLEAAGFRMQAIIPTGIGSSIIEAVPKQ